MTLPYVLSDNSLTVFVDGVPTTIHTSQPNYKTVLDALRARDFAAVKANLTVGHQIVAKSAGGIEIRDGVVFRHGRALSNATTDHILRLLDQKLPVKAELAFLDKLMANPSATVIAEFNEFMLSSKLPIVANGNFRAYKVIRNNWTDKHTGRFDNSVGKTVEMPRNEVDDNRENHCSSGLHFCGFEYTKFFASGNDRLIEVEIDPADVVSFPTDHNTQKGRCSKYVVVRELEMHKDVLTNAGVRDWEDEEEYNENAGLNDYEVGYKEGFEDGYDEGFEDGRVSAS